MSKDRHTLLQEVLDRIRQVTRRGPTRTGDQWQCCCPAHEDDTASLSVMAGKTAIVLTCFAGCSFPAVVAALGLEAKDLFYEDGQGEKRREARGVRREERQGNGKGKGAGKATPKGKDEGRAGTPLTVEALASAKGLPVEFLTKLGAKNLRDAVLIPYRMLDGRPAVKNRIRFVDDRGKSQFRWTNKEKGSGFLVPYGLWRLDAARSATYVVIVEGESDCWTLWHHGIPALGVPGIKTSDCLKAVHLEGIERVYIVRESDEAGEVFIERMSEQLPVVGYSGKVSVVTCGEGCKDPNELFMSAPTTFRVAFMGRLSKSGPLPTPEEVAEAREARAEAKRLAREERQKGRGAGPGAPAPLPPPAAAFSSLDDPGGESRPDLLGLLKRCTDAGNGEWLAYLFGDRLRFDHRQGRWLVWQRHWWEPDKDGAVRRLVKLSTREMARQIWDVFSGESKESKDLRSRIFKWALKSESKAKIDAALIQAGSEPPIADAGDSWDANPWLFGVANGVVDLQTGELRRGRQDDRLTFHTDVAFDPNARAPRWRRFLREVFDGDEEMVTFIRQAVGYSLSGMSTEQCFFILYGRGANGKSVFLNALRRVFGPYAYDPGFATFQRQRGSSGVPEDVAELVGRRLVTANEVAEKAPLNEQRLKVLSHGDPVSARFLYGRRFEFTPCCHIWLGLNHRPFVSDDSLGFWRSIRLVPFRHEFRGVDAEPGLPERLAEEAPGILAWAVAACMEWQREGLIAPEPVIEATDDYEIESDPLAGFLGDCCVIEEGVWDFSRHLFRRYTEWAEAEGLRARERMSMTLFGRRMGERFDKGRKANERVYRGVVIQTER